MLEIRNDPVSLPEIDAEALHRMMDEVSVFGGGPGGSMTRLTLSQEDKAPRLVGELAEEVRSARRDRPDRQHVRLPRLGRTDAPYIMTGSHLDSQPNGGRFDGAYGVIAACSAIEAIRRQVAATGIAPKVNFIIVNWTNEEGARFQPSLLGSGVNAGELTLDFALGRRDGDGISVKEALTISATPAPSALSFPTR